MKFTSSFYKEKTEKNKKETKYFDTVKEKFTRYRYETLRTTL